MKKNLLFLLMAALLLSGCWQFKSNAVPEIGAEPTQGPEYQATIEAQKAEIESLKNQPTATAIIIESATQSTVIVESTEFVQPTPTDWPSIQIQKGQVVPVPTGYTVVGDFSICTDAAGNNCFKNYDDDSLTTAVWTWDEPGYVRMDFGIGWLEHVSDPQVFVDAQLSDGCGNGCQKVDNLRWPRDAALIGATVSTAATPVAKATEEPNVVSTPGTTVFSAGEWLLPSWVQVASGEQLDKAQISEAASATDVQKWMVPEALPLVPPDDLIYKAPSVGDCYAENVPTDSCTTGRLRPFASKNTPIKPGELVRMTGDAISIKWSDTKVLLAERPDGDEKHDLWIVLNMSSSKFEVDINAPYGSDRSWYTATVAWTPSLVDELTRQALQDFNLQVRDETEFAATPVPNCESVEGCTYSNIRVVVVFDDQVQTFTAKWYENQELHWEAFQPTQYLRPVE